MWPWGHLAFGYLGFTGYLWVRHGRSPHGWPVLALAFGTQFPDVVDKPLAYWFAALPAGRSLAHSLLVVLPVCLGLLCVAARFEQVESGEAFALGYVSHVVGDGLADATTGAVDRLAFLVWPILPAPEYAADSFTFHARTLRNTVVRLPSDPFASDSSELFVIELLLAGLVLTLWFAHGSPPLDALRGDRG